MVQITHHVRLINLMGAIWDLSPFDVLTAEEERFLGSLIVRRHDHDKLAVGHIMRDLASVFGTAIDGSMSCCVGKAGR